MALGEEHVPEAELSGLGLEILNDGRVALPTSITLASLSLYNRIGANKKLEIQLRCVEGETNGIHSSSTNLATKSSCFLAASLTRLTA